MNQNLETKNCKLCGAEIPQNFKTCTSCGAKQKLIMTGHVLRCKKCGGSVASNLTKCPHCFSLTPRGVANTISAILPILVFGLFLIAILSSEDTTDAPAENNTEQVQTEIIENTAPEYEVVPEEVINVTAIDLINAFEENEVSANLTYKGKALVVSGIVSDIGVTAEFGWVGGDTYILFSSSGTDSYSLGTVQCYFTNKDEIAKVANVAKGQQIYIKGTCTGINVFNVALTNCFIIE